MHRAYRASLTGLTLLLVVAPALAVEDTFSVTVNEFGDVVGGGGSGYGGGEWYFYEESGWYNQWFSNEPYEPEMYKVVDIYMVVQQIGESSFADITLNWSTPEWSTQPVPPDGPPLPPLDPPDEQLYIERLDPLLYSGSVVGQFVIELNDIIIPDYCPAWVSVDVRGQAFQIVDGQISHECLPEPASLLLLALGGLIVRRRR